MGNCFNPLVEMIPDTDAQSAFEKAKQIATILGIKEAAIIGWVLYIRFSKKIVKNLIKKIVYVFISINQDIKQRYEIQKEFESSISQSKNFNSR